MEEKISLCAQAVGDCLVPADAISPGPRPKRPRQEITMAESAHATTRSVTDAVLKALDGDNA